MSGQLKHIFDKSACLSKRQLKDYANGAMSREEQYAIEHHLTTCFFCSEALDGMAKKEEALIAIDELDTIFLKDHFSLISPQIHLNSIAPSVQAQPIQRPSRKKSHVQPFFRPSGVVAALILGFGILWYLDFSKNKTDQGKVAQHIISGNEASSANVPEQSIETTKQLPIPEKEIAIQNASNAAPINNNSSQKQLLITTDLNKVEKENPIAHKHPEKKEATRHHNEPSTPGAATYTETKAQQEEAAPKISSATNAENNEKDESIGDVISSADELFESGKYNAALAIYKRQMSANGNRAQQHAALQAARCYIHTGQQEAAIKLLETIEQDGSGSFKRQARRMLKDFGTKAENK